MSKVRERKLMTELADSIRLAEEAEQATLWSDAARLYEEALTLLAGGGAADEAALLTALGRCYWNMSDVRASWRTLRRAMATYQERGDGVGLARATVEILRIWGPPDKQRAMAEQALEALGEGDLHVRALLLLRLERMDEAMRIADEQGFRDLQVVRPERAGWDALREGRVDEGVAALRAAHAVYAEHGVIHAAAGTLRGAGFNVLAAGRIDEGQRLAEEATAYARGVHLKFQEELAAMDVAGALFARCDFAACEALIRPSLAGTDFRADAFHMWMTEQSGDVQGALAMLIDPARGGGAPTAVSQIHASSAGVLHHAGRMDAAGRELEAWAEVARQYGSFAEEASILGDCLVDLASDELLREVDEAFAKEPPSRLAYATLQGRCTGYARGALALRLGRVEDAESLFNEGLALAERERCPVDAARCFEGLSRVAAKRLDVDEMDGCLRRARGLYGQHGARLYLDRMAASA
jgi:tetratricopeptide (TPR) repeat protein